jgi:hypothetical protein
MKQVSNYALRLPNSLMDEVKRIARADGTTVNQFISVAVAEKAAALRTDEYFRSRRERADLRAFDRILAKAGSESPQPGDEPLPKRTAQQRRSSRAHTRRSHRAVSSR